MGSGKEETEPARQSAAMCDCQYTVHHHTPLNGARALIGVQFSAQIIRPQQLQTHGEDCGQKWWLMRTRELSGCRDFHLHSNKPRELWLKSNLTKYRYSKQERKCALLWSAHAGTHTISKCHFFMCLFLNLLPSFPSALQLRVSFGLLNNQPPFLSVLRLFRRWSVEW
jgi:hypothetical protein